MRFPPQNVFNPLLRDNFLLCHAVSAVINMVPNHLYHQIGMRKELSKTCLIFVILHLSTEKIHLEQADPLPQSRPAPIFEEDPPVQGGFSRCSDGV